MYLSLEVFHWFNYFIVWLRDANPCPNRAPLLFYTPGVKTVTLSVKVYPNTRKLRLRLSSHRWPGTLILAVTTQKWPIRSSYKVYLIDSNIGLNTSAVFCNQCSQEPANCFHLKNLGKTKCHKNVWGFGTDGVCREKEDILLQSL